MKKKLILAAVLLTFSGVLFARFWPDRQTAGTLVEVKDEAAVEAGEFARQMLEFARKGDRKSFAANCADLKHPDLARQYATMHRTRLAAVPSWKVQRPDAGGNLYLVLIETDNGGAYRCIVLRDAPNHGWKFAGLYDE